MNKCAVKLTPNDNHHHQHHDVEENIILTPPPQKNEEKKKKTPNKNDVKRKHETDIYMHKKGKVLFFPHLDSCSPLKKIIMQKKKVSKTEKQNNNTPTEELCLI